MTGEKISLIQGAGGKAMMKLISDIFLKELKLKSAGRVGLDALDDGATITIGDKTLVLTTDSHTVKPLFFPGGDIGRLAVAGTINDLAVMGAKPLAMSCAMVLEEGFPMEDLTKITRSMDATSREVGCAMVTGDLKVMERSALDGAILTTTGVGVADTLVTDRGIRSGNKIIVTGTVGDHGITILAHREGIAVDVDLTSDVAPLWETIEAALKVGGITAMKDPTRGGLAAALNEMVSKTGVGIVLRESDIPISEPVKAIGEMLGIDPLQITNEGKAIIAVVPGKTEEVLAAIRKTKYGREASVIGDVTKDRPGDVVLDTIIGGKRLLESPIGDPAPRIC
ncbi:MAG TPA: hydrogenase expression/formation protein HypE [Hadesarchaea archaeon]|nr:hydrogenase expression/formation protein HypE [Hadesarchaea archaeon]